MPVPEAAWIMAQGRHPRPASRLRRTLTVLALLACVSPAAGAYPERPIRLIIPSSAGSGPDGAGRIFATRLAALLGQQVVVDNRAGANGIVASEITARAAPDGYTLLITSSGHTINPHIYRKLPYDTLADFTPITRFLTTGGLNVVVHPAFSARSVSQLIELARAEPGKVTYASAGVGNGTHLAAELFSIMANVKLTHIPYKGGGPAIVDLIGGQVPLMFASGPVSIPHVKSGRLRAIGFTGPKRSDQLPDVPAVNETIKGYEVVGWYGLYGPARLPRALTQRLYEVTRDAVYHAEAKAAYAQFTIEPVDTTPAAFAQFLVRDLAQYEKVVRAAGIERQ
jgi:tripartite-type tricarboxylate transporter receptor subunit TctC